jgi:hypothetical protein
VSTAATATPTTAPPPKFLPLPENTRETCDKHPSAKAQVTWYLASGTLTLCGNCARKNGYKGWGKS